jgi:hypothetical protein
MGMGTPVRNVISNLPSQSAYTPNLSNFNDYLRYARGVMDTGQIPNQTGFQQFLGAQPPGGAKNQQAAPPVAQIPSQSINPGRPVMTGGPIKDFAARPQQYGAALSRMK